MASGAGGFAVLLGTNGLGGILNHQQIVFTCDPLDGRHFSHLPEEMDGRDGARTWSDGCGDFVRIDVKSIGLNVDKHGFGAEAYDGADGAEEGIGSGDHLVTLADAERHHGDDQGIGARGNADAVAGIAVISDATLEAVDFRAEDEVLRGNNLRRRHRARALRPYIVV